VAYLLSRDALLAILAARDDDPVVRWSRTVRNDELFVSVVTIGEIEAAAQNLPPEDAAKRHRYLDLLERHVPRVFGSRLLNVTLAIAREWGRVRQQAAATGAPVSAEEAMEIATARLAGYDYVAVERAHHGPLGVRVVDPWAMSS
jgi:predicted nucleic acid-binding protein